MLPSVVQLAHDVVEKGLFDWEIILKGQEQAAIQASTCIVQELSAQYIICIIC